MGNVRILSTSDVSFRDRRAAGKLLAEELKPLKDRHPLILGIPRGGLIPAREVAHTLNTDLDVILAHKLGASGNPELAVGAVVEGGKTFVDEDLLRQIGEDDEDVAEERAKQLDVIKRRTSAYRKVLPRVPVKDRIVIVVDDGVARGLTMKAALWALRQEGPAYLIAAAPVGSSESLSELAVYADEVLCLYAPEPFQAIGQFYQNFAQVDDEEVLAILKEESERKK